MNSLNAIIIPKQYADIYEVNIKRNNDNIIRVYKSSPGRWTFQIRTFKPITGSRKAKSRNMIATVGVTLAEMKEIVTKMEEYEKQNKG